MLRRAKWPWWRQPRSGAALESRLEAGELADERTLLRRRTDLLQRGEQAGSRRLVASAQVLSAAADEDYGSRHESGAEQQRGMGAEMKSLNGEDTTLAQRERQCSSNRAAHEAGAARWLRRCGRGIAGRGAVGRGRPCRPWRHLGTFGRTAQQPVDVTIDIILAGRQSGSSV